MCALHQAGIRKCFLEQAGMCTASITPEYITALYEVLPHSSRLCAPSFCWSRVFRTPNHKANGNQSDPPALVHTHSSPGGAVMVAGAENLFGG